VREVLPFPTLQTLFAKKLKNGMNCFSTGFHAKKIETVHWITTKIPSKDPNVRTKALRTTKAERERERSGGEGEGSKERVQ
jgi:hypothetical protein